MQSIEQALKGTSYPGRGLLVGLTDKGEPAATYFIMGRSENSRNRIFIETSDGIRTQAHDPSKMTDPSLIIYTPVRLCGDDMVVSNGDQTDTIVAAISQGNDMRTALRDRRYEPDEPNFTPRISAVFHIARPYGYELSILKKSEAGCARYSFSYDDPQVGTGHLLHTYRCDGKPLPSYEGEPKPVKICGDLTAWSLRVWDALDKSNRVALYSVVFRADGTRQSYIINRNAE